MNKLSPTWLCYTTAACLFAPSYSIADSYEQRLTEAENRIRQLEQQLNHQSSWVNAVTLTGIIEVEASATKIEGGDSDSDLNLATAELALEAEINAITSAQITMLYEDNGDEALDVDIAAIYFTPTDWRIAAGQFYLPFGRFESAMISDPLTLELGEIRETALLASHNIGAVSVSAYLFSGDISEDENDHIDNVGFSVDYHLAAGDTEIATSAGYINDIQDTDTLQETVTGPGDRAGGMFLTARIITTAFDLIAEYVAATERLQTGIKPQAYNLELGCGFVLASREATLALGLQGTDEAETLNLPRQATLLTLSLGIAKNTLLGFEYSRAEDYNDDIAHALTAQLAVSF